jgi:hypothetical protein
VFAVQTEVWNRSKTGNKKRKGNRRTTSLGKLEGKEQRNQCNPLIRQHKNI